MEGRGRVEVNFGHYCRENMLISCSTVILVDGFGLVHFRWIKYQTQKRTKPEKACISELRGSYDGVPHGFFMIY